MRIRPSLRLPFMRPPRDGGCGEKRAFYPSPWPGVSSVERGPKIVGLARPVLDVAHAGHGDRDLDDLEHLLGAAARYRDDPGARAYRGARVARLGRAAQRRPHVRGEREILELRARGLGLGELGRAHDA